LLVTGFGDFPRLGEHAGVGVGVEAGAERDRGAAAGP
jgi:hypothetical protein